MRFGILLILVAWLASCAQFPELDAQTAGSTKSAPYPDLLPIETLLERRIDADPVALETSLDGRVAALKSRARRMRGAVLSRAERARLAERPAL